jgi:cytochrome c oxidase subunit IV
MSAGARLTLAWITLLVLTATSFGASHLHLGQGAIPVALGIAATKAGIVVLVFMDLHEEAISARVALVAGALMVVLLVTLMVTDVEMRAPAPLPPPPVGHH